VIEGNRPPVNWPATGKVEIHDLQVFVNILKFASLCIENKTDIK